MITLFALGIFFFFPINSSAVIDGFRKLSFVSPYALLSPVQHTLICLTQEVCVNISRNAV